MSTSSKNDNNGDDDYVSVKELSFIKDESLSATDEKSFL